MIEVREVRGDAERRAALALRREVFVDEQGVPPELEIDEHDAIALHLVALDGERIVATCRLVDDAVAGRMKFGRLVVARDARGAGIGRALLDEAERRARGLGRARIVLAAQTSAMSLYERAGYSARGEVFLDAGIEHMTMEKTLA